MFNLIKMDLYRMVNAKSFKVMFVIIALFSVAISYLTYDDINYNEKELKKIPGFEEMLKESRNNSDAEDINVDSMIDAFLSGFEDGLEDTDESTLTEDSASEDDSEEVNLQIGYFSSVKDDWLFNDINFLSFFYADMQSGILTLFIAIFITLFINSEHKNGFEKNIVGHYPERIKPVCSKLIAATVYTFIMMAIHSFFSLCTYLVLLGDRIYIGELNKYLPFLGASILMYIAFSWLICFLCILSRSSSFAMTLGIMMSTNITGSIYIAIDALVYKLVGKNSFTLADHALEVVMLNLGNVGQKLSEAIPTKMIIIPLVYMVFSAAVSIIIMRKRDVR